MSLYKTIDLTVIDRDQFEIEIEITDEEMLEELSIQDVIWHFGEDELLWEMDYDSSYCFSSKSDLDDFVEENMEDFDEVIHKFPYHNEQDIYKRVVELLKTEKVNYNIWEEFLKKYE